MELHRDVHNDSMIHNIQQTDGRTNCLYYQAGKGVSCTGPPSAQGHISNLEETHQKSSSSAGKMSLYSLFGWMPVTVPISCAPSSEVALIGPAPAGGGTYPFG